MVLLREDIDYNAGTVVPLSDRCRIHRVAFSSKRLLTSQKPLVL
jgi:hypothetical protein